MEPVPAGRRGATRHRTDGGPWINAPRFDLRQATDRHGHAARAPETHLLLRQLRPCG